MLGERLENLDTRASGQVTVPRKGTPPPIMFNDALHLPGDLVGDLVEDLHLVPTTGLGLMEWFWGRKPVPDEGRRLGHHGLECERFLIWRLPLCANLHTSETNK